MTTDGENLADLKTAFKIILKHCLAASFTYFLLYKILPDSRVN